MEEKSCEPEPEKNEKKRPSEKQLEALKRGREKRAKLNHAKREEDTRLVRLQKELEAAREENLKYKEDIIQNKILQVKAENQSLVKVIKPPSPPPEPEGPPEPLIIQKPAVVLAKPQKNPSIFDSVCFC